MFGMLNTDVMAVKWPGLRTYYYALNIFQWLCMYRICAWICIVCQGFAYVIVCVCVCVCVSFLWHRAGTHSFPVEASPWCPLAQYLWVLAGRGAQHSYIDRQQADA